jgi:hypothetical protein
MTAVAVIAEKRVDLLEAFVERAKARAHLWSIGELGLREAVDQLEADARRDGLNRRVGIDSVQQILADAFQSYREGITTDPVDTSKPAAISRLPASTIEAFRYVVKQNDPERLRSWLARRWPDELAAFKTMLMPK